MKKMRFCLFAFFLLAASAALPAQEKIAVTPAGQVTAGTVLHFKAYLKYSEIACEDPWTGKEIRYFIACETGNSWWTEFITPDKNAGWKWYDFAKTYTVIAADLNNPDFCFSLYGDSGCWSYWHPFSGTDVCPPNKFVIPHIILQKYFDCSRLPGCPNCLILDLNQLIQAIGDPVERVQAVLLLNGQRLALLGEAGRGRRLPAQFKITLPAESSGLSIMRHADRFLLQVLGNNGQVLASEEVKLRVR